MILTGSALRLHNISVPQPHLGGGLGALSESSLPWSVLAGCGTAGTGAAGTTRSTRSWKQGNGQMNTKDQSKSLKLQW